MEKEEKEKEADVALDGHAVPGGNGLAPACTIGKGLGDGEEPEKQTHRKRIGK